MATCIPKTKATRGEGDFCEEERSNGKFRIEAAYRMRQAVGGGWEVGVMWA